MARNIEWKGEIVEITQETLESAREYFVQEALLKIKDTPERARYIKRTLAGECDRHCSFDYRCLKIQLGDQMDISFYEYYELITGVKS